MFAAPEPEDGAALSAGGCGAGMSGHVEEEDAVVSGSCVGVRVGSVCEDAPVELSAMSTMGAQGKDFSRGGP